MIYYITLEVNHKFCSSWIFIISYTAKLGGTIRMHVSLNPLLLICLWCKCKMVIFLRCVSFIAPSPRLGTMLLVAVWYNNSQVDTNASYYRDLHCLPSPTTETVEHFLRHTEMKQHIQSVKTLNTLHFCLWLLILMVINLLGKAQNFVFAGTIK